VNVKLKVNIVRKTNVPTITDEMVPTKGDLAKIHRKATGRENVATALMAHSGLRSESPGDYFRTDGLRLCDFREANIKPNVNGVQKVPSVLIIRGNLSKARH